MLEANFYGTYCTYYAGDIDSLDLKILLYLYIDTVKQNKTLIPKEVSEQLKCQF